MAFGLSEATRGTFARLGHGLLGSARFVAVATPPGCGRGDWGGWRTNQKNPRRCLSTSSGGFRLGERRDSNPRQQDHNLVLYQLNYAHHCLGHRFDPAALTKEILARKSVRKPIGRSGGTQASTTAAISALDGPGAATNAVPR